MQKFNLKAVTKVICVETQESIPQGDWLEALLTGTVTLHGDKGQYAIVENGTVEYVKGFFGASLQYFVATLQKRQNLQKQLLEIEDILNGFDYPLEEGTGINLARVCTGQEVVLRNGVQATITEVVERKDMYFITMRSDNKDRTNSYEYDGKYLKGYDYPVDIVQVL